MNGASGNRCRQRSRRADSSVSSRVRARYPRVDVRLSSAEDLPCPDDAFDATFAQLVVHFMTDPVAGLTEMARVTRGEGVVAACVSSCSPEGSVEVFAMLPVSGIKSGLDLPLSCGSCRDQPRVARLYWGSPAADAARSGTSERRCRSSFETHPPNSGLGGGHRAHRGDRVGLIGRAVPKPPDVRGMTQGQAQRELEDAGFRVTFAMFPPPYDDVECYAPSDVVGVVIGQDPCPGLFTRARSGSMVTVWIRLADVNCEAPPDAGCA